MIASKDSVIILWFQNLLHLIFHACINVMITPMNTCMYVINIFMLTLKNKAKQNLVTPYKTCYFLSWKFPMNQFFLLKLHDKAHVIVLKTFCFVWIRAVSEPILANVVVTFCPSQALSCLLVLLLPTIQFCRPDDPSLDHKLANSNSRATPA